MVPVLASTKRSLPCPSCKGWKGKGNCFQFECMGDWSHECREAEAVSLSRQVYCGSHPYFGGYDSNSVMSFERMGPSLVTFQTNEDDEGSEDDGPDSWFLNVIQSKNGILIADLSVTGSFCKTWRISVDSAKESIISCESLGVHEVGQFERATKISEHYGYSWECAGAQSYLLVDRCSSPASCLTAMCGSNNSWSGCAPIQAGGGESLPFFAQLVSVSDTLSIGLTCDYRLCRLWMLRLPRQCTIPAALAADRFPSAAEMADKMSCHEILELDLPGPAFRFRPLLAHGPKPNEVVVFVKESDECTIQPRLLLEFSPTPATDHGKDILKIRHVASVARVPSQPLDISDSAISVRLLEKVWRLEGTRSGYLFFDTLGQVHHLPDEAIIPAECVWQRVDFRQSNMLNRAVTFKFPEGGSQCDVRVCLMGTLTRYEYFEKLFQQWQEGATAEVEIMDIEPDTFDHLLFYVHTGTVGCELELAALTKLLIAANKYIMEDLVACSLLRILGILAKHVRMRGQQVEAFADLLAFSDVVVEHFPLLQKKLIESILAYRKEIMVDPEFLKRVTGKSPKALAALLEPVHCAIGFRSKRQKLDTEEVIRRSCWRMGSFEMRR
eukprot:TRINITY_DN24434_c0_g1_i1.p1 TRINITY_DN24434_c0_g1~~TRINITY_DN24434_c0_g1_i1.p1  ORF type:complete len:688 (-),score=84.06 TRINITY_DN24434_c0_g1_i1:140-1972(-)